MSHVPTLPFGAGTTCRRTSRRPPAAILRAVIVLLVCLSCPTQAATLRVGIEPDTSPLSLYDAQGHPSGLAVEIIQGIAIDQRLEVEFVAQSCLPYCWGARMLSMLAADVYVHVSTLGRFYLCACKKICVHVRKCMHVSI
jgi:hypothetical protein